MHRSTENTIVLYSSVTRRALKFVRENENDDNTALSNQISGGNSIVSILSKELNEVELSPLVMEF